MTPQEARRIIESLRAGVPSREVSRVLLAGREELLGQFRSALKNLDSGDLQQLIILSPYGGGKSHFLSAAGNVALSENFAVSQLVLSKETPFNRIRTVYTAAAHAIELPGYPRSGFEEALMKIRPESRVYYDIRDYLEHHLHPKLLFVFRNYFKEGDPAKRSQLYEDLAGAPLPMATLRAVHRANFSETMRMPRRFLVEQDTPDYFSFLSFLVRSLGCNGWVILLDEAELLAKLGIGARAQAYLNLGLLFGFDPIRRIDGIFTVSAFATNYRGDRLLGNSGDIRLVPEWLDSHQRASDRQLTEEVLSALLNSGEHLPAITPGTASDVLQQLQQLHGLAYDWEAQLNSGYVLERTQTQLIQGSIRTTIRAAIEYLDLAYQYPGAAESLEIEVHPPDEGTLKEDAEFYSADGEPEQS